METVNYAYTTPSRRKDPSGPTALNRSTERLLSAPFPVRMGGLVPPPATELVNGALSGFRDDSPQDLRSVQGACEFYQFTDPRMYSYGTTNGSKGCKCSNVTDTRGQRPAP